MTKFKGLRFVSTSDPHCRINLIIWQKRSTGELPSAQLKPAELTALEKSLLPYRPTAKPQAYQGKLGGAQFAGMLAPIPENQVVARGFLYCGEGRFHVELHYPRAGPALTDSPGVVAKCLSSIRPALPNEQEGVYTTNLEGVEITYPLSWGYSIAQSTNGAQIARLHPWTEDRYLALEFGAGPSLPKFDRERIMRDAATLSPKIVQAEKLTRPPRFSWVRVGRKECSITANNFGRGRYMHGFVQVGDRFLQFDAGWTFSPGAEDSHRAGQIMFVLDHLELRRNP